MDILKIKKYIGIAGASLITLIGLFAYVLKLGGDIEENKQLKKEKKENDEDQNIADNINSLDSDDISSRLQ